MPHWMLTCPQCLHGFTYCTIEKDLVEQFHADPFKVLPKPTIPREGLKYACPNCKVESLYQVVDFLYRKD